MKVTPRYKDGEYCIRCNVEIQTRKNDTLSPSVSSKLLNMPSDGHDHNAISGSHSSERQLA